ncbi:hypothetical protein MYX77_08500 [Acidobacteriia bacterium AH_259_A11_L15]|nr:hypothetical protein [Acidobacteriia bacterium AH_259_A11_L15]
MSAPQERRRSSRLTLEVPVHVLWHDEKGTLLEETTRTAIVNRHGALLYLSRALPLDKPVRLVNLANDHVAFARVVWVGDTLPDGQARVGIELTTSVSYEFWGAPAVRLWEGQEQPPRPGGLARFRAWLHRLVG